MATQDFGEDETLDFYQYLIYDYSKKRIAGFIMSSVFGEGPTITSYDYDKAGLVNSTIMKPILKNRLLGNFESGMFMERDENGRSIKIKSYWRNNQVGTLTNKYDKNNNLISQTHAKDGTNVLTVLYKWENNY